MQYWFEDYCFDPEKLELKRAGELLPLRLQPARLLKELLENAPETVSRQSLKEKIWDNGTVVEFDLGLNTCVNQLRTCLGDSGTKPSYVETLPKRGYRFIPSVTSKNPPMALRWKLGGFAVVAIVLTLAAIWLGRNNEVQTLPNRVYVAPVQVEPDEVSEYSPMVQYALRLGTIERLMNLDLDVLQAVNGVSLWKDDTFFYPLRLTAPCRVRNQNDDRNCRYLSTRNS